jgi:hypothetical protein
MGKIIEGHKTNNTLKGLEAKAQSYNKQGTHTVSYLV